jgi:hypothetical protein
MAWHERDTLAISRPRGFPWEQGKAMRKVIWCSIGAISCAAVAFLTGNYLGQPSSPGACQARGPMAENGICSAEELHALDCLLPDPATLTAAFEATDLLSQQGSAKQPAVGLLDDIFLRELAPPEPIRSANEAGEDEEQEEAELAEPLADPKLVEERLKRILQSFLEDGKFNGKGRIDTMEFRPSDAKKGEFDRVPF